MVIPNVSEKAIMPTNTKRIIVGCEREEAQSLVRGRRLLSKQYEGNPLQKEESKGHACRAEKSPAVLIALDVINGSG